MSQKNIALFFLASKEMQFLRETLSRQFPDNYCQT